MPKTIEVSLPADKSQAIIDEAEKLDGLIGLQIQKGASLKPKGDVLTAVITNKSLHVFIRLLEQHGIGTTPGNSISTSEPVSVVSSTSARAIARDNSEATWEEMEVICGKNSNININSLLLMAVSGMVATIGISTNALHIVVGAMIIAPGFVPISRLALGLAAASSPTWKRGLADTARGYAAIISAAIVMTFVLKLLDKSPLETEASYLPADALLSYWTSITATSVIISVLASLAGAILLATNRQPTIGGVMVALALVPAAAIIGMGIAGNDYDAAGKAFLRLLIEITTVFGVSLAVLSWKKASVHKRNMHL